MSPLVEGFGSITKVRLPSLTKAEAESGDGRRHLTPWHGPPAGATPCRVRVPRSPGCTAASRRDASQCTARSRGSTSPRRAARLCTTSCSRWGTATAAYWTVHWNQKHKIIRKHFNLKTFDKTRLHCNSYKPWSKYLKNTPLNRPHIIINHLRFLFEGQLISSISEALLFTVRSHYRSQGMTHPHSEITLSLTQGMTHPHSEITLSFTQGMTHPHSEITLSLTQGMTHPHSEITLSLTQGMTHPHSEITLSLTQDMTYPQCDNTITHSRHDLPTVWHHIITHTRHDSPTQWDHIITHTSHDLPTVRSHYRPHKTWLTHTVRSHYRSHKAWLTHTVRSHYRSHKAWLTHSDIPLSLTQDMTYPQWDHIITHTRYDLP